MTRVAVVGHVEWVDFVAVERLPERGRIEQGRRLFEHAGGGAVVAAAVLRELGADVDFFCALADDARGHAELAELEARGVAVHVGWRPPPSRFALTMLEPSGERTIVTVGDRLVPSGSDALGWDALGDADGVYVTGGDDRALHEARRAARLVLTPRAGDHDRGLHDVPRVDATVFSGGDDAEVAWARDWESRSELMVRTAGKDGGCWWRPSGADADPRPSGAGSPASGRWDAAPLPARVSDSYGAGDSFAAGFTFGLASGMTVDDAVREGARCGAEMMGRVGAP